MQLPDKDGQAQRAHERDAGNQPHDRDSGGNFSPEQLPPFGNDLEIRHQLEDPDGAGNVAKALVPEIDHVEANLVQDLSPNIVRDADAAGLGEVFEAGGDVHSVTEQIAILGNEDVSD